jgi:hypothetical protein
LRCPAEDIEPPCCTLECWLERKGIYADNLSTVSGGSIFGAFYALGGSSREFLDAVVAAADSTSNAGSRDCPRQSI